ncbi:hypothetical protein LCGC14_0235820 [marine sediment metagenome]|uniref:Uncharacterized protein n=1 Tax=marine sediment metagenome TaxID=412755 RepID=A0A0F9WTT8_9ZZZZ
MAVDLILKKGDTRSWQITLSDTDNTALNLVDSRTKFWLRTDEGASQRYMIRDTSGVGSDNISASDTSGIVTITITTADWVPFSDNYGIFVGEFWVSDANDKVNYTKDITVHVQEAIV